MATDARGHTVPAGSDHPSRTGGILTPLLTVRDVIPVANTTARATLITALTAASPSQAPSTTNPVYVYRADAIAGRELEVTEDGTTWLSIRSGTIRAAYTVTLTGTTNPNIGTTGTTWGNWNMDGEFAEGEAGVQFAGTGVTAGSGLYALTIPTAPLAALITNGDIIGHGTFFDSSTGFFYVAQLLANSTTTCRLLIHGQGALSATAPVVPAVNDRINVRFRYPVV